MSFTVTDCTVTTNSITVKFSDTVLSGKANPHGGDNPANYALFAANSVDFIHTPPDTIQEVIDGQPAGSAFKVTTAFNATGDSVTFKFTPRSGKREFEAGEFVHVVVRNVQSNGNEDLDGGVAITGGVVQGRIGRLTRDVEDAISYPILTEEIGYRPSPVGIPTGGGMPGAGAAGGLGQVAAKAVSEVLGWKPNVADPRGFVGALTQSFTLTDVEGHVESTWTPRTYAVQTDLGGGITGAQASLYTRAKNALDSALPLLDGLYPLDPEADPEYVKALREMARSQMTEIVKELGVVGLPSILRIDTYFNILLGQNPAQTSSANITFDPDQIAGTLGELRDTYGINFAGNKFNNSVEDEQDITNFRVISDYMTSLMQSWMANRDFFIISPDRQAFFGTQLVLISRQFNVIAETVNEVRFALDSVFIGPNERQTLLLQFDPPLAPMFLEDILSEVEQFATDEGPRLLRDGGKISVTNNILPVVQSLENLVKQAHHPENIDDLPDGFRTARVRHSLDDLGDQLETLVDLIEQVEQEVPPSEDKVTVSSIGDISVDDSGSRLFPIFGAEFDPAATVTIFSTVASGIDAQVTFFSAQRIDAEVDRNTWLDLSIGSHDVTVTSAGQTATLRNAFTIIDNDGGVGVPRPALAKPSAGKAKPGKYRVDAITPSGATRSMRPAGAAKPVPDTTAADLKKDVAELKQGQKKLQTDYDQISAKLSDIFSKLEEALALNEAKAKAKNKNDKSS